MFSFHFRRNNDRYNDLLVFQSVSYICLQLVKCQFHFLSFRFCTLMLYLLDQQIGKCREFRGLFGTLNFFYNGRPGCVAVKVKWPPLQYCDAVSWAASSAIGLKVFLLQKSKSPHPSFLGKWPLRRYVCVSSVTLLALVARNVAAVATEFTK